MKHWLNWRNELDGSYDSNVRNSLSCLTWQTGYALDLISELQVPISTEENVGGKMVNLKRGRVTKCFKYNVKRGDCFPLKQSDVGLTYADCSKT